MDVRNRAFLTALLAAAIWPSGLLGGIHAPCGEGAGTPGCFEAAAGPAGTGDLVALRRDDACWCAAALCTTDDLRDILSAWLLDEEPSNLQSDGGKVLGGDSGGAGARRASAQARTAAVAHRVPSLSARMRCLSLSRLLL